jgi:hypothetical protein
MEPATLPTTESKMDLTIELSQLLLANLHAPTFNLSQEQINWINQFISSSPDSFAQIANDVKAIRDTGKIGVQTIPQIIHLCADIYNNASIKNGLSNPANIIVFIKFTLDTILSSKLLPLPEVEKELIQQLVDTSLNLLSMNLSSIETEIGDLKSVPCCRSLFHFFSFT